MSAAEFCEMTGADMQTAKAYLEMTNNNLERAIDLFFDGAPVQPKPQTRPAPHRPTPPGPAPHQPQKQPVAPRPAQPQKSNKDMIDDIFEQVKKGQGPPDDDDGQAVDKRKITFWKNGFQVDDGEFRSNDDPANSDFLASVSRGQVPRELYNPRMKVDVEVEDNRDKDYKPPKVPVNPFAGKGHSLNDSAPPKPAPAAAPSGPVRTDYSDGRASTKVRIQLPTGTLLTLTVAQAATIGELKQYIAENSGMNAKTMKLKCTFPPKDLNDNSASIVGEGLKMATIAASN